MTLTAVGELAPGKPCKDERRAINRFMAAVRNAHRAGDARTGPNQSQRTVGLEHRRWIGRHADWADQSRRLWLGYQPRRRLRRDPQRSNRARPWADPARPAHHG